MTNERLLVALAACLALAIAGCDDDSMEDPDSGTTPMTDGGSMMMDGGGDPDAGGDTDGGSPMDDAGMSDPDAGPYVPSCDMGMIRIQQTCEPAFTACGGDIVGSWCYADICITKDELLEDVLSSPGVPAECTADMIEIRGSMGTISGTIEATATQITRMVTTSATGSFFLPSTCTIVNCRVTQAAVTGALGASGSATCADEGTGCLCDITFLSGVDETNDYTASGNAITLDSGRVFDYCVEGDGSMRFRETDATGVEPGVQTALPVTTP